jgi:ubiquitin conjugation factor E4 B
VQFEYLSFLGPFFSIPSTFGERDPGMKQKFFPGQEIGFAGGEEVELNGFNIGRRNVEDVKGSMGMLYGFSESVVDRLYGILIKIIKSGADGKEAVLGFMAECVNLNLSRGKMQVDRTKVATDGFMMNLVGVAGRLSEPLLDQTYSKLKLIDPYYFCRESRIDLKDVTRINADQESADAFFKEFKQGNVKSEGGFVSELFYVNICVLHYGLGYVIRQVTKLYREVEEKRQSVRDHEGSTDLRIQAHIRKMVIEIEDDVQRMLMMKSIVLDPSHIQKTLAFYNLVIVVIMRSVFVGSGVSVDSVQWNQFVRGDLQGLNFDVEGAPKLFATLPEWIFEDICEYYLFIVRYSFNNMN